MKIALMQPYFMPYLGYFQLINAVDKFIFFDDAHFIKQGWINRNNILLDKEKHRFCLPIKNMSSNKMIHETYVAVSPIHWDTALLKKIHQAYHKAPFFDVIYPKIEKILRGSIGRSIADVSIENIEQILDYLGVKKTLMRSAGRYDNSDLRLTAKVIDICKKEGATVYINAFGGQNLFHRDCFKAHQIDLFFIKPNLKSYPHFATHFVGGLSILDILMHNNPTEIRAMLDDYNLM
jgi:WbqC-like protein family